MFLSTSEGQMRNRCEIGGGEGGQSHFGVRSGLFQLTFSLPHLLLMLLDHNWHLIFKSQLSTHLYFVKKFDLRRSHGQVELCRGGAGQ